MFIRHVPRGRVRLSHLITTGVRRRPRFPPNRILEQNKNHLLCWLVKFRDSQVRRMGRAMATSGGDAYPFVIRSERNQWQVRNGCYNLTASCKTIKRSLSVLLSLVGKGGAVRWDACALVWRGLPTFLSSRIIRFNKEIVAAVQGPSPTSDKSEGHSLPQGERDELKLVSRRC